MRSSQVCVTERDVEKLTASLRPLRVGVFNMRASNTSSVSRLTYSRTEKKKIKNLLSKHCGTVIFIAKQS